MPTGIDEASVSVTRPVTALIVYAFDQELDADRKSRFQRLRAPVSGAGKVAVREFPRRVAPMSGGRHRLIESVSAESRAKRSGLILLGRNEMSYEADGSDGSSGTTSIRRRHALPIGRLVSMIRTPTSEGTEGRLGRGA